MKGFEILEEETPSLYRAIPRERKGRRRKKGEGETEEAEEDDVPKNSRLRYYRQGLNQWSGKLKLNAQ